MSKNYALVDENNKVINIIIANDNFDSKQNYIEYTDKNPAHIGGDYLDGYFYSPQPFPSWSRNGLGSWQAPVPMPDKENCIWNEELGEWYETETF
jgi:hypothetical protein